MATNNSVNVPLSGSTGTGNFVGATSPTLVTPALGTPASGTLTNCTGYPVTMVLKKGSGGGDYSSASTSYVDVDGTNLAYTVTVPSGYKVYITAAFTNYNSNILNANSVALTDGTTVLAEQVNVTAVASVQGGGTIAYQFTGDGASHTFKLRYKTSANTTSMVNGSATNTAMMSFLMLPSA